MVLYFFQMEQLNGWPEDDEFAEEEVSHLIIILQLYARPVATAIKWKKIVIINRFY